MWVYITTLQNWWTHKKTALSYWCNTAPHLAAEMTESGVGVVRFSALRLEILAGLLFMILPGLQGGVSALVRDHHHSYESLGPYFYHDIVNGTNVTDTIVFGGKGGAGFGTLSVFDDPLTVTPDIKSTTVARAQGLQVVNSFDGQNALITSTVVFPNGTLSFIGAFLATQSVNRFHCLGGTGGFQSITHGYMELTLYKFGPGLNAVMNITMYLRGA